MAPAITDPMCALRAARARNSAGRAMSAWRSPPMPNAAAPMARGPTSGAKVATVPVVPHNAAAPSTATIPSSVPAGCAVRRVLVLLARCCTDDSTQFHQSSICYILWGADGDIRVTAQRKPGARGGAFAQRGVLEPWDLIDLLELGARLIVLRWSNPAADNNRFSSLSTPRSGIFFGYCKALIIFAHGIGDFVHQGSTYLSVIGRAKLRKRSRAGLLRVFIQNFQRLLETLRLVISMRGDRDCRRIVRVIPRGQRRTFGHIANLQPLSAFNI